MSIEEKLNGIEAGIPVEVKEEKEEKVEKKVEVTKPIEQPVFDKRDGYIMSLKGNLRDSQKEILGFKKDLADMRELMTSTVSLLEQEKKQTLSTKKINDFAEKQGVDADTIRELMSLMKDETTTSSQVKEVKQTKEEKSELPSPQRLSRAVDELLEEFLESTPEYKDLVDVEAIKDIILDNPSFYLNKSPIEIVEKIYGKQIKGKAGIEKIQSQNRSYEKKTTGKLTDKEFTDIKDDPEAMKSYRKNLVERAAKYALN